MSGLCKYKDALGKPEKGIHSYRFMNIAIIDVIMTIIAAFIIGYLWFLNWKNRKKNISKSKTRKKRKR